MYNDRRSLVPNSVREMHLLIIYQLCLIELNVKCAAYPTSVTTRCDLPRHDTSCRSNLAISVPPHGRPQGVLWRKWH